VDAKTGFGIVLLLGAIAGLIALVTGWLSVSNGQIVIGQPQPAGGATSPTSGTSSTSSSAGNTIDSSNVGGASWGSASPSLSGAPASTTTASTTIGGNPNSNAVAQLLGTIPVGDVVSNYYDPSTPLAVNTGGFGSGGSGETQDAAADAAASSGITTLAGGDGIALNPFGFTLT